MGYASIVGRGLQHSSGRIIGLGRLLLAVLYLVAILIDASQPARAASAAYGVLAAYLAFAAITVVVVWKDWWLDAKIAGAAHAIDILFFTLLVLLTEGYTSPFFTFFMFVLLAAAIRWGWRATALTAILLVLLYLIAGLLVATASPQVELRRFAVRTGHLTILSLILIWFGASRWGIHDRSTALIQPIALYQSPLEIALRGIMAELRAESGAFVWRTPGERGFAGVAIRGGEASEIHLPLGALNQAVNGPGPFLYDAREGRCLRRDSRRNLVECRLGDFIHPKDSGPLGLGEGLAVPVRSADGDGVMFVEGVRGLSVDHIDLGAGFAAEIAAHVQAHALLRAADESAEARSRLTLARDLHDGVVQFLAGTAFRLEAMRRSNGSGRDLAPDLDELKDLILQEQHELRTFITALRAGPAVPFDVLANDLRALADRLSRQWDVRCTFTAQASDATIPARLHLDVLQLTREAVANAVRHAEAKTIRIQLSAQDSAVQLQIDNSGLAPHLPGGQLQTPKSLQERVDRSGGSLDISRAMDFTRLSIVLPIPSRQQ